MSTIKFRPFLFLDLDGTVRYSKSGKDFIQGPEDVAIFPDVASKLLQYKEKDYPICAVTNQGGVAFGYKTEGEAFAENRRVLRLLRSETGKVLIDKIEVCFTHEKGTIPHYAYRSLFRKPDIGMLVSLEQKFLFDKGIAVDYENSLLVGDREEDQRCAECADIAFQWAWDFFGREKPVD